MDELCNDVVDYVSYLEFYCHWWLLFACLLGFSRLACFVLTASYEAVLLLFEMFCFGICLLGLLCRTEGTQNFSRAVVAK